MRQRVDLLLHNIGQLVTLEGPPLPRRGAEMSALGLVANAAVAVRGDRIVAAGPEAEIRSAFEAPPEQCVDAERGVVLPGFVDPHTHAVFAGSREAEFELRCQGKSYQEIAAAGGGIRSSVRAFRSTPDETVLAGAIRRLGRMLRLGTTTVEVKTGYGLSTEHELRALRLIDEADRAQPVELIATFLGAHEFPDEYRDDREAYVRLIVEEMLPRVAAETGARFCDVFCEEGVFTAEQSRRILGRAKELGLGVRLHADEFAPVGGSELAAELGAWSADHLLEVTEHGLLALRSGGVTAVLLPATSFSLGGERYAPARRMVQMEIPVALATDCNPGSSMCESMPLVLSLACLELGLTPAEAVTAATVNSAFCLGLGEDRGRIAPGLRADLQLLDAPSYVTLIYHLGVSHVRQVWKDGVPRL